MRDRFPLIYHLATHLFTWFYFPFHGGLKGKGMERVPREGGVILAANHMSHLDPPAIAGMLHHRRCRAMSKEELWRNRLFGATIQAVGAVPVRRGEGDMEAIRKCLEILKGGEAMIIFPEGVRGGGEKLGPFAQGTAMLAKKANVPVVPIGIAGTQRIWPAAKTAPRVWSHRVTVVFGEPFRYEDVPSEGGEKEHRKAFLAELERRIVALTAEAGIELKPSDKPE